MLGQLSTGIATRIMTEKEKKNYKETMDCTTTKLGEDNYIGSYFKARCGWGTYNIYDISHFEWHRRGLAKVD